MYGISVKIASLSLQAGIRIGLDNLRICNDYDRYSSDILYDRTTGQDGYLPETIVV